MKTIAISIVLSLVAASAVQAGSVSVETYGNNNNTSVYVIESPQQPQMQQPMYGQFCGTPYGVFGPGPVQPVGSACWAGQPWNPIWGYVIN